MTTKNLASHFARLEVGMAKFNITEPEQIFNLEDTGFSTTDIGVSGSTKRVVGKCDQANGLRLRVPGCDRITVMPVVSADETAWRPVVIVPGKKVRVCELQAGKKQTVETFFHPRRTCTGRWMFEYSVQ